MIQIGFHMGLDTYRDNQHRIKYNTRLSIIYNKCKRRAPLTSSQTNLKFFRALFFKCNYSIYFLQMLPLILPFFIVNDLNLGYAFATNLPQQSPDWSVSLQLTILIYNFIIIPFIDLLIVEIWTNHVTTTISFNSQLLIYNGKFLVYGTMINPYYTILH